MKRKTSLLCALLLAIVSIGAFVFVFPAGQSTMPEKQPAQDTEQTQPTEQSESTEQETEPTTESADDTAPLGTHPMDGIIEKMTLEQKVAQMFWVRCPDTGAVELIEQYSPAGYVLFARDFEDKTRDAVAQTVQSYQDAADIPLLIGTDEEGGTVVRASRFKTLRSWPFESPQEVYAQGGMEGIEADTAEKDRFLLEMGINVNLAPVADVSTNANDFMYARTFGKNAADTSDYVGVVVRTMKQDGMGSVLKHFPGYGSNGDTHTALVTDTRPASTFRKSDFLPFQAGIRQGADAVLVSHNIIEAFDANHPASLSPTMHQILREELGFDGVIVTDDLSMEAITQTAGSGEAAVQAVQAGNDLLLSSDFVTQYQAVLDAVNAGTIDEDTINSAVRRVLQWKSDLGLLEDAT